MLARLVDEHDAADLSYSTVRDYVASVARRSLAEAGRPLEAGFVPQTHPPAAEAEVDFHDLWVMLARGEDEDRAVHDAAVVLGAGGAPGVR